MLSIDNLKECFKHAIANKIQYVAVVIETKGSIGGEIIINPNSNFKNKMEYYERAYTYDLTLKAFNGIKIVGFTYGNSFDEIESNLYGKLMNYE